MLTRNHREPPPDPEEVLKGECKTCRHCFTRERWECEPAGKRSKGVGGGFDMGQWAELPSAECPQCGARVFMLKRDTRQNHPLADDWR